MKKLRILGRKIIFWLVLSSKEPIISPNNWRTSEKNLQFILSFTCFIHIILFYGSKQVLPNAYVTFETSKSFESTKVAKMDCDPVWNDEANVWLSKEFLNNGHESVSWKDVRVLRLIARFVLQFQII